MAEKKMQWDSNFSFLMAMIGAAVGLGNIWRFPYVLYSNGEGTFLIPYVVSLVFLGLSFILFEYAIGYKFKTSVLDICKKIRDRFQMVGWSLCLIVFIVTTYYICIVGWDLIYLVLSFFKGWGANPDGFFSQTLLQSTPSIAGITTVIPVILVSTVIVWAAIWYISHKDLNDGIGKFTKWIVPLLVVLMAIVVFYSLTLPGASLGYGEFVNVDWGSLANPNVWLAAFGQVLFSLSLGMGIVIAYASYLPENSNLTKNAVIVLGANSGFEIFNALGIFSILGFMALESGAPLNTLVSEGTGLAFVAFPKVFNVMGPASGIIGPIFFLCILIAGITSAVGMIEPLVSSLADRFEISRKRSATIVVVAGILITSIFTTGAGNYLLTIFDEFLNNYALIFIIILQCIIFGWYYKIDNLIEVLDNNALFKVGRLWKAVIKFAIPIILAIIWVHSIFTQLVVKGPDVLVIDALITIVLIVVPIILYYRTKTLEGKSNES
ncbi:MAG: sodium-dependent transporter [Methanobrevibacter sp.]|uniref:sodium-dependent transporter n=1 Tax=Methanobrevibacter sp. TaxID=66852 RepID=UPI0026E066F4|nr:sodium-dependent transporter [Methanobrevibacter sp.]MDO5848521.1 sodium-dependent transporter [Methanobrevibacter sp.]